MASICASTAFSASALEQVGLVQDDEIGGEELILEDLLERVVVIERRIGGALFRERVEVGGEAARGNGRAVHHGDNAIHGGAGADVRPVEGFHQRLRQRQPRRLDYDVIGPLGARQQRVERRHEIVRDGAAQAAVGQLDDVLLGAAFDAAGPSGSCRRCRDRRTR